MKSAQSAPVRHLGIVLDRPPEEVDPGTWTGGQNVAFSLGATYRTGGYARFGDPLPASGPIFALNVIVGANAYWIYCTATKVYVTDGVTHWDITPATALTSSLAGDWTGCLLNGIPVLCNGLDAPIYWNLNTASKCTTIPGWPSTARCKAIRSTKYHLIALNITDAGTNYPTQLWWSSGAQAGALPQEWTPTASNDAGDAICGDSPGDIVDGLALRDGFVVYKNFSTYIMQYVAGQYVFTTRKLFDTTGIQTKNCAIEVNGTHYVFTGTDVIVHDGQSYKTVAEDKVLRTLVQSVDPGRVRLCSVTARILNHQLWVCIPEQGHAWLSKAYVFDTVRQDWGVRVLPEVAGVFRGLVATPATGNSWDVDTGSWDSDITFWDQQAYSPTQDSLLMCDAANSHLFNVDVVDTADGAPVYAYVERLGAELSDRDKHKIITGIVPDIVGSPGDVLTITLGGQQWFNTPISWGDPQTFVIGTDTSVDSIVDGRLLSVRIEGTTAGVWKLYDYQVRAIEMGRF